jgi:hypothetical protein
LRNSQNSRIASVRPVAERGWDQVDVALGHRLAALGQPGERPVDLFTLPGEVAAERLFRQQLGVADGVEEVIGQAVLVAPLLLLAARLVVEAHGQPRAEHRLGAQRMAQPRH